MSSEDNDFDEHDYKHPSTIYFSDIAKPYIRRAGIFKYKKKDFFEGVVCDVHEQCLEELIRRANLYPNRNRLKPITPKHIKYAKYWVGIFPYSYSYTGLHNLEN